MMARSEILRSFVLLGIVSLFLKCVLLVPVFVAASSDDEGQANNKEQQSTSSSGQNDDSCGATTCGMYLAKSSIPNSGLGLFSGTAHSVGDILAPPEIAHQILLTFNGRRQRANPEYFQTLVRSYTWDSFVSGGGFEASYVESLIPGIGMAANCFTALVNTRSVMGKSIDSAGLYSKNEDSNIGPGAGAFSAYHGMTYVAETSIEAGAEIFADYGDSYFRDRVDVYGNIPLKPEFEKADKMIRALWSAFPRTENSNSSDVSQEWQPMWDAIRQQFVEDERTRNALPKQVSDLSLASELGTARHFLYGENPRSIEWLETNGYCTDTLDVRNSAIPDAGRGAFAKRSFAEEERILPLPLLQIPRASLDIFGKGEVTQSRQLLLNYCFGHTNSSLLLMPYSSSAGFINHASGTSANAKVVWATTDSDPSDFHRDEWMSLPPNELQKNGRTGLLMHVVALRDISEGEEVTIDYGQDWADAWEQHVKVWDNEDAHVSAAELNESVDVIRTIFEDPYPPGVDTACHYRFGSTAAKNNPNNQQNGQLDSTIVAAIEDHAPAWVDLGGRATVCGDYFRPCKVIARHRSDGNDVHYTVKLENRENHFDWDKIPDEIQHFVKNVPPRAILFVDKPFSSHQQYKRAFRHEIGFPDPNEMWPAVWRDRSPSR